MKRIIIIFLCVVSCLMFSVCACGPRVEIPLPDEVALYYFYDEPCGSCDGTEEFYEIFNREAGEYKSLYPYNVYTQNVFGTGVEVFEKLAAERGIGTENQSFPLLVVGGKVYYGLDAIENNIAEAFLTAGEDIFENEYVYYPARDADRPLFERYGVDKEHVTLVYFYRITCEECGKVKHIIDGLPETAVADGKTTELDIIRINTRSGDNGRRVQAFFEAYEVPEEKQMVPVVFLADTYLSGYDEIEAGLADCLARGRLDFEFPK